MLIYSVSVFCTDVSEFGGGECRDDWPDNCGGGGKP